MSNGFIAVSYDHSSHLFYGALLKKIEFVFGDVSSLQVIPLICTDKTHPTFTFSRSECSKTCVEPVQNRARRKKYSCLDVVTNET